MRWSCFVTFLGKLLLWKALPVFDPATSRASVHPHTFLFLFCFYENLAMTVLFLHYIQQGFRLSHSKRSFDQCTRRGYVWLWGCLQVSCLSWCRWGWTACTTRGSRGQRSCKTRIPRSIYSWSTNQATLYVFSYKQSLICRVWSII